MATPSFLNSLMLASAVILDAGAHHGGYAVFRSETCFATLRVRRFDIMPEREKTLTINEIYHSIQGESTWAGRPCVFVRLTFCNLRCNYCDTEYAFYEGKKQKLKEIADAVEAFHCALVEITGGEPLLQKNVLPLMSILCDAGHTVLLETSGAHDISEVDPRVHRIMDLKTPGSGEVEKNLWSNIDHLTLRDEVKFVMGSREDYEWSCDKVRRYNLPSRCHAVLFSPIFGRIDPREIVDWILADKLDVRFQLQMHKFIWSPTQRGV
jgi:7-carboxy-7-deazaguanine synthase